MAHTCPRCGSYCTCRGDCDDIDMGEWNKCRCPCPDEDDFEDDDMLDDDYDEPEYPDTHEHVLVTSRQEAVAFCYWAGMQGYKFYNDSWYKNGRNDRKVASTEELYDLYLTYKNKNHG